MTTVFACERLRLPVIKVMLHDSLKKIVGNADIEDRSGFISNNINVVIFLGNFHVSKVL
jgi:hypothetical protein